MTDYFHTTLDEQELQAMSMLGLAHIGDAVYELLVRSWLTAHGKTTAKVLHRETVRFVAAPAQAKAAKRFLPLLNDEEAAIYKRGRNAKVNSIPKNADISEYHAATALEALFGWLYLKGQYARIDELFDTVVGENHAS